MEKEKLKLIVRNLRLLVDALESEVYSDVEITPSRRPHYLHWLIMMRSLKTMNEHDWRYTDEKLEVSSSLSRNITK